MYELYDKRDAFPIFIIHIPHLSSNIPSNIFYGYIFSEIIRLYMSLYLFLSSSTIFLRILMGFGKIKFF